MADHHYRVKARKSPQLRGELPPSPKPHTTDTPDNRNEGGDGKKLSDFPSGMSHKKVRHLHEMAKDAPQISRRMKATLKKAAIFELRT
ncbi:MAG: hypothetical protein ACR2N1_00375 [Rubripirellula sp.]